MVGLDSIFIHSNGENGCLKVKVVVMLEISRNVLNPHNMKPLQNMHGVPKKKFSNKCF